MQFILISKSENSVVKEMWTAAPSLPQHHFTGEMRGWSVYSVAVATKTDKSW